MRFSSKLEVDLSCLEENYRNLKKLTPNNETLFMIKANAYGHGINEIARFAFFELGIKSLGVAALAEAMELRKNSPDLIADIYVFSDTDILNSKYKECYLDYNIIPVIHSLNQLEEVLSDSDYKYMPLVIKFNTGMNRIGIPYLSCSEVISTLKKYNRSEIHHLMTHFSSSYIKLKEGDRTFRQLNEFKDIKNMFIENGIVYKHSSCANSGAIEQGIGLDDTMVRPGLMLYGPQSVFGKKSFWNGKCISSLKTTVITKEIYKKGTPIGYGGHVLPKDGVVCHIPIGYGDGVLTYYQGLKLQHGDLVFELLGRVNMDMTALFFEINDSNKISIGDELSLWINDQESINKLCIQAKTIPYQVFTAITERVPRSYKY